MAPATTNRLLRSLSAETRGAVLGACERTELQVHTVLDRVGEPTASVIFPETAVISTLATYSDGTCIEMANIGREACTGIGLILGHARQLNTNEVQVGGAALRIGAEAFLDLKASLPEFETALFSAVQAVFYQVMVSGACNGAHGSRQRLARWLLTMRDRSDDETLNLTHDFLAEVLGLRRATVSEAAADLQASRCIAYSRGRIRILDRAGLHAASCECYDLVRDGHARLLPERSDRD